MVARVHREDVEWPRRIKDWDSVRRSLHQDCLMTLRAVEKPYLGRRACRNWVRALHSSSAFKRIVAAMEIEGLEAESLSNNQMREKGAPYPFPYFIRVKQFIFRTYQHICDRNVDLRGRARYQAIATTRATTTVEVLQGYLHLGRDEHAHDRLCSHAEVQQHWDLLQRVANDIYCLTIMDSEPSGVAWYDTLVGWRGDHRAFMIRWLDRMIPAQTVNRFAAIAEVLRISGYPETTPQLVRAIIKKGHT